MSKNNNTGTEQKKSKPVPTTITELLITNIIYDTTDYDLDLPTELSIPAEWVKDQMDYYDIPSLDGEEEFLNDIIVKAIELETDYLVDGYDYEIIEKPILSGFTGKRIDVNVLRDDNGGLIMLKNLPEPVDGDDLEDMLNGILEENFDGLRLKHTSWMVTNTENFVEITFDGSDDAELNELINNN